MAVLHRIIAGCRSLLRRAQAERALDAELQDFLATAVEDKMRSGLSREAAIGAARIEMGSAAAVNDGVRDIGWESIIEKIVAGRPLRNSLSAQITRLHWRNDTDAGARPSPHYS